jgi:hypothetical protein
MTDPRAVRNALVREMRRLEQAEWMRSGASWWSRQPVAQVLGLGGH